MSYHPKSISYQRAIEMMRQPNTRLAKMHTTGSPEGFAYFIIPGGYVSPEVAAKIQQHVLVQSAEDGLFPGIPQTWSMKGGSSLT